MNNVQTGRGHSTLGLRYLGFSACTLALVGCASPAQRPPVSPGMDANGKAQVFANYRLTTEGEPFFGYKWKRKDGEYSLAQLQDVFDAYPEPKDLVGQSRSRALVIGLIADAGGAIVGWTLGWNLTANDANRYPTGTQIALYSTGGGLILTSIVLGLAWHDPAAGLADAYNRALAHDLGVALGARGKPVYDQGLRFTVLPAAIATPGGNAIPAVVSVGTF